MFNMTPGVNALWPKIHDEASAREAAKQGWSAALVSGGITLLMVATKNTPIASLIDVGFMCLIGYGCLKMSRAAAIIGLLFTLSNGVYKYIVHSTFGLMPLFAIFFVNSIRGTFLFHKIKGKNLLQTKGFYKGDRT
jgi:hypothetical protein